MWYFTGIKLHATKSIDIMNVWLSTLKSVNSSCTPCHPLSRTPPNSTDICFYLDLDKQLASSLGPFLMTNAAETIRYTSAGWTTSGIESFSMMLLDVFYPVLNDFSGVQYEANVGTGNTKAVLAFGVFTENTTVYVASLVD